MARTLEDIARELIATVDADAGYLLGVQWLVKRYGQLATRTKLRHLRQVGQLSVPAPVSAGTITATRGSQVITGDATATAAWSNELVGWHIRPRTNWYEIVGYQVVGGVGQLRLLNTYEEDTSTDGTYYAVLRWVPVDPEAAYLGNDFVFARRFTPPLKLRDYSILDATAPSRPLISGGPGMVVEAPTRADGVKRVELYPYSSTSENYFYLYWRQVADLTADDVLPSTVPAWALIEGASIDLYRYKMAQAITAKNNEAAAFWRNEMRTQETKWERYLIDMIGADRGQDDTSFLLQTAGFAGMPGDITTARQHIVAGWNWQP